MNYSNLSANEQRLQIAAFGYSKAVTPDCYDMQSAMDHSDIAIDARGSVDPAKDVLAFAVFLKSMKMAGLTPYHVAKWLSTSSNGRHALSAFAGAGPSKTKRT